MKAGGSREWAGSYVRVLETGAKIAEGSGTGVGRAIVSVFISYSSEDRRIAETICKALEARGHRCWIAFRDVKAGENFQEAIVKALREARVMLLVFSSNANNSEEIKKELVLAGRHRITVMPVRIEDVAPSDAFAYELATRQWIDLFRDWESEIEGLSLQVGRLDTPVPPGDAGSRKGIAAPAGKKSGLPLAIGIAAAILLLLGAAALFYGKSGVSAPKPAAPEQSVAKASAAPVQMAQQTPSVSTPPVAQTPAAPTPAQTSSAPATTRPAAKPSRPNPVATPAAVSAPVEAAQKTDASPPPAATEDQAWQAAGSANTRAAFGDYLKAYPGGPHVQDAQLRIATLILATPATGSAFDGNWQTVWTCPNVGSYLGYTYQFAGRIKDGVYHGVKGEAGQPSSMVLDGRIESDGAAAFSGEVIVGSSLTGLGAARGTASDFHAGASFAGGSGQGRRLEGRACNLSFTRQ
jgi:TIR domain